MKTAFRNAFTLIEVLTVMLIIAVIAGLVMGTAGYVSRRGATERANVELSEFRAALESYKNDVGAYPRSEETDDLDPKRDGSPISPKYKKSTELLYAELANDKDFDGKPDGKGYIQFKQARLGGEKRDGKIVRVQYIQDPFGNSYGYSTAGAKAEEEYQTTLRTNPNAERDSNAGGFNPTYDVWSTAGAVIGDRPPTDDDRRKWIKNW